MILMAAAFGMMTEEDIANNVEVATNCDMNCLCKVISTYKITKKVNKTALKHMTLVWSMNM